MARSVPPLSFANSDAPCHRPLLLDNNPVAQQKQIAVATNDVVSLFEQQLCLLLRKDGPKQQGDALVIVVVADVACGFAVQLIHEALRNAPRRNVVVRHRHRRGRRAVPHENAGHQRRLREVDHRQ